MYTKYDKREPDAREKKIIENWATTITSCIEIHSPSFWVYLFKVISIRIFLHSPFLLLWLLHRMLNASKKKRWEWIRWKIGSNAYSVLVQFLHTTTNQTGGWISYLPYSMALFVLAHPIFNRTTSLFSIANRTQKNHSRCGLSVWCHCDFLLIFVVVVFVSPISMQYPRQNSR